MDTAEGVCCKGWQQRLEPCRDVFLYFWRALSFQTNVVVGLSVWFLVHVSLWLVLGQDASLLYITGNVMLLISLAIVLSSVTTSYGSLPSSDWADSDEESFRRSCVQLEDFEHTLCVLWSGAGRYRQSKPFKFYASGLALAGIVFVLDNVLSAVILVHFIACCILLLPLCLHKGLIRRMSDEDLDYLLSVSAQWICSLFSRGKLLLQQAFRAIQKK